MCMDDEDYYQANTLRRIQDEVLEWTARNFPPGKVPSKILTFYGLVEELGELAHSDLKAMQGIRVNEDHEGKARDAVGDILIYLLHHCIAREWNLNDILETTWDKVKERNWKDYPKTGFPEVGDVVPPDDSPTGHLA